MGPLAMALPVGPAAGVPGPEPPPPPHPLPPPSGSESSNNMVEHSMALVLTPMANGACRHSACPGTAAIDSEGRLVVTEHAAVHFRQCLGFENVLEKKENR